MVSPFSSKTSTVWLAQRSRKTTSSMVSVPEPVASRMLKSDFLSTQSCRDLASHTLRLHLQGSVGHGSRRCDRRA